MAKAPKSNGAGDTALVKALADILDEAGLAELEYETADLSVRLSRVSSGAPVAPIAAVAAPAEAPAAAPAAPAAAPAAESVDAATQQGEDMQIADASGSVSKTPSDRRSP